LSEVSGGGAAASADSPVLEVGIRAISLTPIIRDRSTFSYLKRTKIQTFDQKFSNFFRDAYSKPSRQEGAPLPQSPPSQPMLSDPPIFLTLHHQCHRYIEKFERSGFRHCRPHRLSFGVRTFSHVRAIIELQECSQIDSSSFLESDGVCYKFYNTTSWSLHYSAESLIGLSSTRPYKHSLVLVTLPCLCR